MSVPILNLEDYSNKVALHCNTTYYDYILSCLQLETHLLGCIFTHKPSPDELPILIKQKLALVIAAAKHKYMHPDSINQDMFQYVNWVVWDVDDGGAYVWLTNILEGLAIHGIHLQYSMNADDYDEAMNQSLHIQNDLNALVIASDGEMIMPSSINAEDPVLVDYVTSLLNRLPHPLSKKKPAF